MKTKFQLLLLIILVISCSKPSNCIEISGDIISKTIVVPTFTKIKFYKGIAVVLTQGSEQKVEIHTGENLMSSINVSVTGDMLVIKDEMTCNWFREYGQTTVYITAPDITDIISKSEKSCSSKGVLTYQNLRIESLEIKNEAGTGDFNLQLQTTNFSIESNSVSNFYISGQTVNFTSNLYEGNGRIEAQNLIAQNINLFHRGSNDMMLYPVATINGSIYSTGNVICKNYPTTAPTVVAFYHGKLIFN